jgi:phospholipid/cholesterol/gamma-HCH transport system permease protein
MAGIVDGVVYADRTARVRLSGEVVTQTVPELESTLSMLTARRDLDVIELELSRVTRVDTSAIAIVEMARRDAPRIRIELVEMNEVIHSLFENFADKGRAPLRPIPQEPLLERIGERIIGVGRAMQALGKLVAATVALVFATIFRRTRLPARAVGDHVAAMGTSAVGIVGLLGGLVGMSIAFQSATQLRRYGAASFANDIVGLSMVRELAPLMTALIVTGRTGAAIAAELGTMRAGNELDALKSMGIDPVRFVVVPRVLALLVVLPILTLVGMFVGLVGGMVVAELVLRMSPLAYWWRLAERLDLLDFGRGLLKSFAFAWIIGLSGAHLGMRARPDANGVGRATTRAVVTSVFWIIVFDSVFESVATILGV